MLNQLFNVHDSMLRTKSNTTQIPPETVVTVMSNANNQTPHPTDNPPSYVISQTLPFGYRRFERMRDDSNQDRKAWKTCEHYKCTFDYQAVSGISWNYVTRFQGITNRWFKGRGNPLLLYNNDRIPPPFGYLGLFNSNLPVMYSERSDGGFVPEPANLVSLQNAALSVILPRIKAELSIINSIIELKDFKSLGATLVSAKNLLTSGQVFSTAKKTLKKVLGLPWKQYIKGILDGGSGGYLQTQFAILPLLSDIAGIHRAISSVERRLNDLITREGKTQVRHCSYNVTLKSIPETAHGEAYILNTGTNFSPLSNRHVHTMRCFREVLYGPTRFHVQAQYNYNYTAYQREHARMLALLDAFGFTLNPAIIWNALPWSFVVDWLFGVSKWLDQFDMKNLEPKINIHRCLWSISGSRKIGLMMKSSSIPPSGTQGTLETRLPYMFESSYRREQFMPSTSSIISSGLSSKEFSLGAALVIAQRRRFKRR